MGPGEIRSLGSVNPWQIYQGVQEPSQQKSFAESLGRAVNEVNDLQHRRDDMVNAMISGKEIEVHDVMTAAEEAQLAFELLLEVRSRLLESYQQVMRMQV